MMEEQPHRNGLYGDTNNSEEQRSGCSASECWGYVLDGLMDLHLPDAQEDAGIATCIRDALLYGCAEFGTVASKVEMDSEKTVTANTAKCQNVLMNLLRLEEMGDQVTVNQMLEVCRSPKCEDAPHDNSRAMVVSNVNSVEGPELAEIDTGGSCKICGDPEDDDKRFLICGHSHCLYKYYHIRCLKSKQIAGDVQRGKPCCCDEAYHIYCITPRRTSIPKGRWYCSSCSAEKAKEGMKQYERRTLKLLQKD
nr:unnamed protein product [Digitaria exilis]